MSVSVYLGAHFSTLSEREKNKINVLYKQAYARIRDIKHTCLYTLTGIQKNTCFNTKTYPPRIELFTSRYQNVIEEMDLF